MLKSGTLTFLMTDIEGSTRLWEQHPGEMRKALILHDHIVKEAIDTHEGKTLLEQGEGDSTFSAFEDPTQAARAALAIRYAMNTAPWPAEARLKVRIALHTGVPDSTGSSYFGRAINRTARLRALANPGQVLITGATKELLDPHVFPSLKDHGLHRLRDLLQPEHIYELPTGVAYPALKSLNHAPNNLPIQLTSFVGRACDIANVEGLREKNRLVTILGIGGSGKTRLALQVAAEVIDHFPDGVYFLDLIPVSDAEGVRRGITKATRTDSLAELAGKRLLLIFDNCEHMPQEAARVAKEVLSAAGETSVLATSRAPLQLTSETVYRLQPLGLPSAADMLDPAKIRGSEAVQLFTERAAAKVAAFELTESNAATVGEIVRKLDGIALAIELAAPRLKVLSLDQLLARLEDRFGVLRGGDRTESERHQTLLATLEYSYELLSEAERHMLMTLAVFRGGWTLEAAEAVAPPTLAGDKLELLEALYDKSFTQCGEPISGFPRSFLLETIRDYALSKSEQSSGLDAAFERLVGWLVSFVQRADGGGSPDVGRSLVDAEMPNIAAALTWCRDSAKTELGLKLCCTIWQHWRRRGDFSEGRNWLREFLSVEPPASDLTAMAFNIAGTLAYYQNDFFEAGKGYASALTLYEQLGNEEKIVAAQNNLGLVCVVQRDYAKAAEHFDRATEGFRHLGRRGEFVKALINSAAVRIDLEQFDRAKADCLAAVDHRRDLNDAGAELILYLNLCQIACIERDACEAAKWLRTALDQAEAHLSSRASFLSMFIAAAALASLLGDLQATAEFLACESVLRRDLEAPAKERTSRLREIIESSGVRDLPGDALRCAQMQAAKMAPGTETSLVREFIERVLPGQAAPALDESSIVR